MIHLVSPLCVKYYTFVIFIFFIKDMINIQKKKNNCANTQKKVNIR